MVSSGTIFGGALLIGLVNIVLLTAMATIGAFIYNLTTDIVGGVEVTLADRRLGRHIPGELRFGARACGCGNLVARLVRAYSSGG